MERFLIFDLDNLIAEPVYLWAPCLGALRLMLIDKAMRGTFTFTNFIVYKVMPATEQLRFVSIMSFSR